jgi:hypothetical protein
MVHEEEFGACVELPAPCATDDDCGEYLSCQSSDLGECWESSDGESGCTEPDPDAASYCAPAIVACETDDECPRDFECAPSEVCPAIACTDGDECEQPVCEASAGECLPKEIECEDDSSCPTDWSCVDTVDYDCSGGGSSDVDDPGTDGDPPEPDLLIPEEMCTEMPATGHCQPDAWDGGFYGGFGEVSADAGTGDDLSRDESEEATGDDDDGSSSDSGGCTVASHGNTAPVPFGLVLLLGAPLLALRRRLARIDV